MQVSSRLSNPLRLGVRLLAAAALSAGMVGGCSNGGSAERAATGDVPAAQTIDQSALAQTAGVAIPSIGSPEVAVAFYGQMPTGVAVSHDGRIFVSYPRWEDHVMYTVGEILDGKAQPYPDQAVNTLDLKDAAHTLISVQSVVIDPKNRLWLLDSGSFDMKPPVAGAPKLVRVDLETNKIVQTIQFPSDVALPSTYLNDVRFDMTRGQAGMAFITDSVAGEGPGGIIVVDLATGQSWRKLNGHESVTPDPNFAPTVEGEKLMMREPGKSPEGLKTASDGIAIDPKSGVLYFCPMASRRLYCVSLDALSDQSASDKEVVKTLKRMPDRDFASDGLECDSWGTLYLTDYEHNAIRRLTRDGKYEIVAQSPSMIWPDSMSFNTSGLLYFTANQLDRQKKFHDGEDLRKQPYALFRVEVGGRAPVAMK